MMDLELFLEQVALNYGFVLVRELLIFGSLFSYVRQKVVWNPQTVHKISKMSVELES